MRKTPHKAVLELDFAFNKGDLEATLSFYENNATVVIDPQKIIQGKTALREAFTLALSLKGTATQLKTKVIESEDLALFISKWVFKWTSQDGKPMQRESFATTVFRKHENGEWFIAIDNSFGTAVLGEN